jgi:predicted small secreted protein/uncharacterized protein YraI
MMKKHRLISAVLVACLVFLSACNLPQESGKEQETPEAAIEETVTFKVLKESECYLGPGADFTLVRVLEPNQTFRIISIDTAGAWYQVNPNELIDPEPPEKPPNENLTMEELRLRCWVPNAAGQTNGELAKVPIAPKPIIRTGTGTTCYAGPGTSFAEVRSLDVDQYFKIYAIDDDVVWIDDDVVWTVDGAAWFQINPNELVDPNPPDKPLIEGLTLTEEELSLRCWVPRAGVQYTGDLLMVPVISIPDETAVVRMLTQTSCYFGPGMNFGVARVLEANQAFRIAHVAADGAWYQVNPNEMVDPDPPGKVLPESLNLSVEELSLRCWVPSGAGETRGDLGKIPIFDLPLLGTGEQTNCYAGPGMEYQSVRLLDAGQYYRIFAIDDDVVWIDGDVVWIADGAAWFQINPNEMMDPDPPGKPLDENLTMEELSLRCWVPRRSVQYTGDLFSLPVVSVPVVTPTEMPTATMKPIVYPTATPYPPTATPYPPTSTPFIPTPTPGINCSDYTTFEDCMEHANYGCEWNPNTNVCYQRP